MYSLEEVNNNEAVNKAINNSARFPRILSRVITGFLVLTSLLFAPLSASAVEAINPLWANSYIGHSVNYGAHSYGVHSVMPFGGSGDIQVNLYGALARYLCDKEWAPDCKATQLKKYPGTSLYYIDLGRIPWEFRYFNIAENGDRTKSYGYEVALDPYELKRNVLGGKPVELYYKEYNIIIYDSATHEIFASPQALYKYRSQVYFLKTDNLYKNLGCHNWRKWREPCAPALMRPKIGPNREVSHFYETDKLDPGDHMVIMGDRNEDYSFPDPRVTCKGEAFKGPRDPVYCMIKAKAGYRTRITYEHSRYDASTGGLKKVNVMTAELIPIVKSAKNYAHWLEENTFALPQDLDQDGTKDTDGSWELYWAKSGGMKIDRDTVTGADGHVALVKKGTSIKDPHLPDYIALKPDPNAQSHGGQSPGAPGVMSDPKEMLRGQLMILYRDASDAPRFSIPVQTASILDNLYAAQAASRTQGLAFENGIPTLSLWAPTAKNVKLLLFDTPTGDTDPVKTTPTQEISMNRQNDGSWTVKGDKTWLNRPYRYDVEVYIPAHGLSQADINAGLKPDTVMHNQVTDPNSVALSADSTHSVIVDLSDEQTKPAGWDTSAAPKIKNPTRQNIYQLHVRDFSIAEQDLPEALRGTYGAFSVSDSAGMKHLERLAKAGMNTIQLLPTNDFATLPELRSQQIKPVIPSLTAPSNSENPQAAIEPLREKDGYDAGYKPLHYGAVEGSYASDGNLYGARRVKEYRTMIHNLHKMGYRITTEQAFGYTQNYGQGKNSVFEKIVPGYYYQRDNLGQILTTTGAPPYAADKPQYATQRLMAQQLMINAIVNWVKTYKIDGLYFDHMAAHSAQTMKKIRAALDSLTPAKDGVDGKKIYMYGQNKDFNAPILDKATPKALAGTKIGTLNEYLRKAIRGHGPTNYSQGLGGGLGTDKNEKENRTDPEILQDLQNKADLVRLGLAGNLFDYEFTNADGTKRRGEDMMYEGQNVGVAASPEETINYVGSYQGQTLYDALAWAMPQSARMEQRVRMQNLSLASVALSQSPMFWQAGADILRSKSLDANSYDSSDHFNQIDFSLQTNNFGVGLPPKWGNKTLWNDQKNILSNTSALPREQDMQQARDQALDLLRLRNSTALFTLGTSELIKQKVHFPNSGTDATPGVIAMHIADPASAGFGPDIDPQRDHLLVVFNATPDEVSKPIEALRGLNMKLHEIQASGKDPVVKTASFDAASGQFTVPGRTVAVFEVKVNKPKPPSSSSGNNAGNIVIPPREPGKPGEPGEPGKPGEHARPGAPGGNDNMLKPPAGRPGSSSADVAPNANLPGKFDQQNVHGKLSKTGTNVGYTALLSALFVFIGASILMLKRKTRQV